MLYISIFRLLKDVFHESESKYYTMVTYKSIMLKIGKTTRFSIRNKLSDYNLDVS